MTSAKNFDELPDYAVLNVLRTLNDIELMQMCVLNKRMQRLCGYTQNPSEGIYDLSLKRRIDAYKEQIDNGDLIIIKDIKEYYPIVTTNPDVMQYAMQNIKMFNPHLFFIKGDKIGKTVLHTGAGLFFTAYAPDLGNFSESTFTGQSNDDGESINILNHFVKNGYSGVIGFIKDNKVYYIYNIPFEEYKKFKDVLEKSK